MYAVCSYFICYLLIYLRAYIIFLNGLFEAITKAPSCLTTSYLFKTNGTFECPYTGHVILKDVSNSLGFIYILILVGVAFVGNIGHVALGLQEW